jgi:dTDP-glucose pyrophosphorylase/CBS domain-containing protein
MPKILRKNKMKKWEKIILRTDAIIEDAIKTLDREALGIVLVLDSEEKLRGVITDGDIRRALMRRLPITASVSDVMNKNPHTAPQDATKAQIKELMNRFTILQVPIIDHLNRVVGLETLQDIVSHSKVCNPVFLMAGGFGTRLRPLTDDCPKPLLKVGEKPILEDILDGFLRAGFQRFFISTHYLPKMIRDHFGDGERWGASITYIHEEIPLGTGGALSLLPKDEITEPLVMMNGDLVTALNYNNLLRFHLKYGGSATMCIREYDFKVPFGVVETNDDLKVVEMVEKPVHKLFVNAGIYVVSPELIHRVKHGQRIDMPTLLEQEIAKGRTVNSFPLHEYWLDIGRIDDFNKARQDMKQGILNAA